MTRRPRALLLDQDQVWQTALGEVVKLEDMDPRHKRNIVAMLERQVMSTRWTYDMFTLVIVSGVDPDSMASDALDAALDEEWAMSDMDWLHSRKLVRRLDLLIEIDKLTETPDEPPPTPERLRAYFDAIGKDVSDEQIQQIIDRLSA